MPGETEQFGPCGESSAPRPVIRARGLSMRFGSQVVLADLRRLKWAIAEMPLSPGDEVVVGLKDYRVLPHYPLRGEAGAQRLKY